MKESQSLARIPDTLVYAMEFINMPTPAEQAEGLEELRKTVLRLHPDLKVRGRLDTSGGRGAAHVMGTAYLCHRCSACLAVEGGAEARIMPASKAGEASLCGCALGAVEGLCTG